ncbi:MAG TPA: DUF4202 domain-containing protein [Acidimicrobiales bacterium]|nr:DUF4202 domain-containing protein [Acidimicrobiales bacterium]
MGRDRFERAVAAIDAANADDPNRIVIRGVEQPKELGHAALATAWLERLRPDADESLRLAVRAHHLKRWAIPRQSYPDGRAGYLRWRTALKQLHAAEVGRILADVGYDDATIERVQDIVRKRGLGTDPDVQVLEDVVCLVFLETQLHDLAAKLAPDHIVEVVRKTLPKMSEAAKELALGLDLDPADRAVLERAVAG